LFLSVVILYLFSFTTINIFISCEINVEKLTGSILNFVIALPDTVKTCSHLNAWMEHVRTAEVSYLEKSNHTYFSMYIATLVYRH